ncbi:nitroreductase family protein [Massarina eburnea CBS 473.64]|uniref:Nitroreductase family protein n=1 Tax=Massarina eburnea CBS 473.64 TaxID=1395130 RepID=A0A6A6RIX7_9PLEO|nr:nitroreductase family protein [Massarina eburnea CBS 473.64]
MSSTKTFLEAAKERRSIYGLNKEAPISDKKIVELVEAAATHVPSAFNSQSTRLVVLLNEEHDTFWDQVRDVLKEIVPAEQWTTQTEPRIKLFKAAKGSILFFEDPEPIDALKKQFAAYADHFGGWSEHTSGMHQYFLWVALEAEGFGANLQHYNPIIDQKVQAHYKIPLEWKLRAQLVFGGRAGEPKEKQSKPLESKVFVHGAKE